MILLIIKCRVFVSSFRVTWSINSSWRNMCAAVTAGQKSRRVIAMLLHANPSIYPAVSTPPVEIQLQPGGDENSLTVPIVFVA